MTQLRFLPTNGDSAMFRPLVCLPLIICALPMAAPFSIRQPLLSNAIASEALMTTYASSANALANGLHSLATQISEAVTNTQPPRLARGETSPTPAVGATHLSILHGGTKGFEPLDGIVVRLFFGWSGQKTGLHVCRQRDLLQGAEPMKITAYLLHSKKCVDLL
ncbi:MAG: hypothetical protein M1820_010378 [Bogoriella megaspora]|nr:MAG: hypothetical protein M1820_010378 [Bogoriella megaspora]